MLRFLSIKRLAVIDSAEIEFDAGLNVLTGETGAGKSILIGAVGLLLGERATGDLVRTGEDSAVVEAVFERDGREVIVRREVTAQGRSRAFVDGELATASALRDLSGRLVELHGQHAHQALLDPSSHLAVLDGFAGLEAELDAVRVAFDAVRDAETAVDRARQSLAERSDRQELIDFQLAELDRVEPRPGEDEQLTAQRRLLSNAERVERLCAEGYGALYESDNAILAGLGGVWRRVGDLAAIDQQFQTYLDARAGIKSQLEDLAEFLRAYGDRVEASPERLQQVEDRLAVLERLKRKHGPTLAEVLARRDALRSERADLQGAEERVATLEEEFAGARESYVVAADHLSARRRASAKPFSDAVRAFLAELAMGRTGFEARFREAPPSEADWTARGFDEVEFYLSTNAGEEARPLARIVSGGELSRVMLAIKTVTFRRRLGGGEHPLRAGDHEGGVPGLIFDEVDTGIGGAVADVVGRRLRALGSAFQVLCITHLPQIAAHADVHFQIAKRVEGGRTRTSVQRLDREGRVEELARMLGGASITEGIRTSARELLALRSDQARPGQGAKPAGAKGEGRRAVRQRG